MRQHEDNRTGDLLDGSIRQRGRPATGHAKTGAQRQSERRKRLKVEGKGQLTVELPQDVLDGLNKFIQSKPYACWI